MTRRGLRIRKRSSSNSVAVRSIVAAGAVRTPAAIRGGGTRSLAAAPDGAETL